MTTTRETPVFVPCWKCGGTGVLPEFAFAWDGLCLACNGTKGKWSTVEREARNAARREKAAAKRAAEAAVKEAAFIAKKREEDHEAALREDARRAQRAAEKAAAADVPTGRIVVEGEVVSVKWQDSSFGGSWKMLVKHATGWKVWGTVPSSIDPERGDIVRLTATVKPSPDDRSFGFYSRPTKADIVVRPTPKGA